MTRLLLVGMLAGAAITPGAARAQTEPRVGGEVEELVVTAQRREERLQDVPLSVSAQTGSQLDKAGVQSTAALSQVTPGLYFANNGGFAQPTIRGIGTRSAATGDSTNVATYVDGVYQPSQSNFTQFNNVDRVEVLKGPQGTLFGRNATGGAINIVTRTPSHVASGKAEFGIGRFDERRGSLYVTGPLGDRIAADLAVSGRRFDGYATDLVNGRKAGSLDAIGVRSKVLIEPTDQIDITVAGDWSNSVGNETLATKSINGNTVARRNPLAVIALGRDEVAQSFLPFLKVRSYGAYANATIDLGFASLTSITAGRNVRTKLKTDSDVTQLEIATIASVKLDKSFSEDVYLISRGEGPLQWIVGGMYFDASSVTDPRYSYANSVPTRFSEDVQTKAYAAYVEATYHITGQLQVIGGLRYSSEEKSLTNARYTAAGAINAGISDSKTWDNVSYRLTAKYEFSDDFNVYLTNSTGFKSGAYNSGVVTPPPQVVKPETIDAFEAGFKSQFARSTLNGAAFYYKYHDIQISRANSPLTGATVLENAAEAEIKGFELQGSTRLTDGFQARLGIAYTDATYSQYPFASVSVPITCPPGSPASCVPGAGNVDVSIDAKGKSLIRAPEWQINGGLDYETEIAGGAFEAALNLYHSSTVYFDPSNLLRQKPYTVVNGQLSWTEPGERWKASAWVENLTDEVYAINQLASATGSTQVFARPRSYGVTIGFMW